MDIKVGKYRLRSDRYCLWIDEEFEGKDKNGKPKTSTRKVGGYSRTFAQLYRSFAQHSYRASEAQTVKELLKVLQQTENDLVELKKTALKEGFRIIRNVAKEIDEK